MYLNFERIKVDAEKFNLTSNDSYIETYPEFLRYFDNIDIIEKHHLLISSHFVYGWMPTIINLNTEDIDEVLSLLNSAKKGNLLNADELEKLKKCINNSLVGSSKLLHFINPNVYAIYDSRIFRYITRKKSQYGIGNVNTYLNYLSQIKDIINHKDYNSLHSKIESFFDYQITPMRTIEIVMFESDRKNNSND